jgi:hypothetical protein
MCLIQREAAINTKIINTDSIFLGDAVICESRQVNKIKIGIRKSVDENKIEVLMPF